METAPIGLNPQEEGLYQKCLTKNPGLSIEAFKELREKALSIKNPEAKKFYEVNGILMQEMPDEDAKKEMSPRNMN